MSAKEAYIDFCERTPQLPLFLRPWWLDAVTQPDGKTWEVLLARNKKGEIEAVMPYVTGQRLGMRYVLTPQLTQYTGVWIKDIDGESAADRLSREKKLQNDLIGQLEAMKIAFFDLKFPLSYTWWSPFYWAGYQQETHYTYRIEDLREIEQVFAGLDITKQNKIHKAEKAGITIDYEMSADELYDLQCAQLNERGSKDVLSRELVRSVVDTARCRKQGLIARAKDREGHTHAAAFVVWDEHSAYDLVTAIHPDHRSSGASTLMIWEAIKHVSDKTQAWDFEGSMIENVESSFRQFGGVPVPYFEISKKNKIMSILEACRK